MNRNNLWIHITLAVVLVAFAAVLGQMNRWRTALSSHKNDTSGSVRVGGGTAPALKKNSSPEVLVRFKPNVSLDKIRSIASVNHDSLSDRIESVRGLTVIDDLDNADAKTVAEEYSAMSEYVEYAEPNFEIRIDQDTKAGYQDLLHRERKPLVSNLPRLAPNDPMFGDQWALNNSGAEGGKERADIDALTAWQSTVGSEEVVVAVLDSGVDFNHEDLRNNMWTRPANLAAYNDAELGEINDLNGYNGTDAIKDPMDDNGHGTHCAGIIGAEGNNGIGVTGINQKVQIMPLKFLGRGGFGSTNDAIEAINYAIDRKLNGVNVRVISASWGSTSKSKALEDTIKAAAEAGILFVAAAGNDGSDNDKRPHYPSNYNSPNIISVAALDRNDQLASFSNYGVKTVHVAAPGKDILSTWLNGQYREASGTSMATPYVSGVAALIIASDPQISMKNLRARLLGSADNLSQLEGKVETGSRICAANALGNIVKSHTH